MGVHDSRVTGTRFPALPREPLGRSGLTASLQPLGSRSEVQESALVDKGPLGAEAVA